MSDFLKKLVGHIYKTTGETELPEDENDIDAMVAYLDGKEEEGKGLLGEIPKGLTLREQKMLSYFLKADPLTGEVTFQDWVGKAYLEDKPEQDQKFPPQREQQQEPKPEPSPAGGTGEFNTQQWEDMNKQYLDDLKKNPLGATLKVMQWGMQPMAEEFRKIASQMKEEILESRDLMDNAQLRAKIKEIKGASPNIDDATARELAEFRLGIHGDQAGTAQSAQPSAKKKPVAMSFAQATMMGPAGGSGVVPGDETEEEDVSKEYTEEELRVLKSHGIDVNGVDHKFYKSMVNLSKGDGTYSQVGRDPGPVIQALKKQQAEKRLKGLTGGGGG